MLLASRASFKYSTKGDSDRDGNKHEFPSVTPPAEKASMHNMKVSDKLSQSWDLESTNINPKFQPRMYRK